MRRRDFLAVASVATAAAQVPQTPLPPKAAITSSVMLWTLPGTFEEKLRLAAAAGIQSVELVTEYASWSDSDFARNINLCRSLGLTIDALLASPDWSKRPVSMLDPSQREGFLGDVRNALATARRIDSRQIILMSGNEIPDRPRAVQYASMLEGARRAADLAAVAGFTLLIEPLNSRINHKGYFLNTCGEGLKLVREVANPHFRLLFDIYHEQVQAGDVIRSLTDAAPHVGVFHVADNPGRHEPGTGEINWTNVYQAIRKSGFGGYVCFEYLPTADPLKVLKKAVNEFRAALAAGALNG